MWMATVTEKSHSENAKNNTEIGESAQKIEENVNDNTNAMDNKVATQHSNVNGPQAASTPKPTPQAKGSGKMTTTNQLEQGYYKNFINPMLADMAKHAKKNEDILDEINRQLDEGRDERRKARLGAHIPDQLKGHGQAMEDIVHELERMILDEDFNTESPHFDIEAHIQSLDEHSEATVLAHSLAAHIQTLDTEHLRQLTEKVRSDCRQWLTKLFRFKDGSIMYHEHPWDGVTRICRLALHQRYPKYATEGFEALYSRPPVVYISAAAISGYGHYICAQKSLFKHGSGVNRDKIVTLAETTQDREKTIPHIALYMDRWLECHRDYKNNIVLGLPMSCLNVVPCNTMFGSNHKMDVAVFEKLVQDDIAAAKTPVLLIAYAGTPVVGHVDKLERLQDICEANSIWMHVEGSHLATLTMFSVPTSVSPAKSGDSMTVTLAPWLGLAGLPSATIYKQVDHALAQSVGLDVFNPSTKLACLPLWVCLQSLGHEGIVERVKFSCNLAKVMFEKLSEIPSIKQVSKEKEVKKEEKEISLSGLISKAIHAMVIFEIVSPTVVFKFIRPPSEAVGGSTAHYSLTVEDQKEEEATRIYYDSLNAWLCEGLSADNPSIALSTVDVEREGICLRFSPLTSAQVIGTTMEDVENFVESVKQHIAILQTTVDHRKIFKDLVTQNKHIRLVDKPNWAGLGVVQYLPEDAADTSTINAELVQKLKNTDAAFSLGETDGMVCVRFGLIGEGTHVQDLIDTVVAVGAEVEEASKYLERMTDVIRKGIDETNKELQKEVENRLRSEGVLRQVPIVSAFVNWWSPPPKDTMTGRSFNMQSGEVSNTKATYRYHMQIQDGGPATESPVPDMDNQSLSVMTPTFQDATTPVLNSGPLVIGSSPSSSSTSPFMQLDAPTDVAADGTQTVNQDSVETGQEVKEDSGQVGGGDANLMANDAQVTHS